SDCDAPVSVAGSSWPVSGIGASATTASVVAFTMLPPDRSTMVVVIVNVPLPPLDRASVYVCPPVTRNVAPDHSTKVTLPAVGAVPSPQSIVHRVRVCRQPVEPAGVVE